MKVLFISVTLAVVYLIRYKRIIRVTYDKDRDTFRSELLIAVSAVCALIVHEAINGAGYIHYWKEVRRRTTTEFSSCRVLWFLFSSCALVFLTMCVCYCGPYTHAPS